MFISKSVFVNIKNYFLKIYNCKMIRNKVEIVFVTILFFAFGCESNKMNVNEIDSVNNIVPLFKNSIVSTELDFIKPTDTDAFMEVVYIGQKEKEMPGAENNELIDKNTFVFEAVFSNRKKLQIWCHSAFGNKEAAKGYVNKLTDKLGKLPEFMRDTLAHVVIHKGNSTAFSEDLGRFFVLYSDNMDERISNNDLEETVFHESIHVALDLKYSKSDSWKNAQKEDGTYITEYAKNNSNKEDLAESAIFVYTMIKHPRRLPTDVEEWVKKNIPNRYEFLKKIFNQGLLVKNS